MVLYRILMQRSWHGHLAHVVLSQRSWRRDLAQEEIRMVAQVALYLGTEILTERLDKRSAYRDLAQRGPTGS